MVWSAERVKSLFGCILWVLLVILIVVLLKFSLFFGRLCLVQPLAHFQSQRCSHCPVSGMRFLSSLKSISFDKSFEYLLSMSFSCFSHISLFSLFSLFLFFHFSFLLFLIFFPARPISREACTRKTVSCAQQPYGKVTRRNENLKLFHLLRFSSFHFFTFSPFGQFISFLLKYEPAVTRPRIGKDSEK